MGKHEKLVSIPFQDGKHNFCLDRVPCDDEKGTFNYAFVWRGNKKSPDGFIAKPAYFGWRILGQAIRKAINEGKVPAQDKKDFLAELFE